MTLTRAELRKLAPAVLLLFTLAAVGAALIWYAELSLKNARAAFASARTERMQNREKLSKIAEEERDVKEKLEVYRQLRDLHVLGEERRLEWADTVSRIRKARELPDLRYQVQPQRLVTSLKGNPAPVDFYESVMKVNLGLLHEGDLFAFLDDLRASGNAYYDVRRCAVSRTGQAAAAPNLAPRLNAECDIALLTIIDRAAKP